MTKRVGILAYRAFTDEDTEAAYGLANFGRWFLLDELAPGWEELPNSYLLWSTSEDTSMVGPSVEKFLKLNRDVKVIVALGRQAARALGVPNSMEWFAGYRVPLPGRRKPVTVIPVPSPSPVNRTMNDPEVRRKMHVLMQRLTTDASFVDELTTGDP